LIEARVAGAYALYGVRAREVASPETRARFTAAMNALGANAWPVIRAALEQLAARPQGANVPLVDDLLASAPDVLDEAAGEVVSRYLGAPSPATRAAATLALTRAWGRRASAMFVGLLQDTHDAVRAMAVSALAVTQSIDEHVARRLFAMLTGKVHAGEQLQLRVAQALRHVAPSVQAETTNILSMLLASGPKLPVSDSVAVAVAQTLMHVSQQAASPVLLECAKRMNEPLRGKVVEIVRTT
jgi:hypothetical protein